MLSAFAREKSQPYAIRKDLVAVEDLVALPLYAVGDGITHLDCRVRFLVAGRKISIVLGVVDALHIDDWRRKAGAGLQRNAHHHNQCSTVAPLTHGRMRLHLMACGKVQ